eukprot:5492315-Amphidinium_carterae.1
MSVGSRHTSCHQFSQIIAIQRWMSKHAGDLAAATQEEIQARLLRAANVASQDGRLDDTLPDSAALPSSANEGPANQDNVPTTPNVEGSSRRVRRRFTSKKSQSLDSLPATQAMSSGRLPSLQSRSQAASAACAATPLDSPDMGITQPGTQLSDPAMPAAAHDDDNSRVARRLVFDESAPILTQKTVEAMPTSVLLRMAAGENDRLCSVRMSDGAIRWRLQNQSTVMAQSALGEAHALRKWLIKFGSTLHAEGRSEIETALQIMGVESGSTPIPPTRPYHQQLADASLVESYNAASAAEPTQLDVADTWHEPLHNDPFHDL